NINAPAVVRRCRTPLCELRPSYAQKRIPWLPTCSASALSTPDPGVNSEKDRTQPHHHAIPQNPHESPNSLPVSGDCGWRRVDHHRGRGWSVMDIATIAAVIVGAGGLGILVWALAKLGRALIQIAEALAAATAVFLALWLVIKAMAWAVRQTFTHWRTSLTVLALLA